MANSLQGRKVLVGVTGGIAAYKIHFLIRELVKNGAEVQVIMTEDAHQFVTPLSLSTLSRKPVYTDFYNTEGTWNNHVDLALWADVMLIAPCTANTLAKMATGLCDNLLQATYLSAKCPVFVAPAMDLDMYAHPTTTENLKRLRALETGLFRLKKVSLQVVLWGLAEWLNQKLYSDIYNNSLVQRIQSLC